MVKGSAGRGWLVKGPFTPSFEGKIWGVGKGSSTWGGLCKGTR